LEKFTRRCTSPVNGEGLKLEMDLRLAHLQEGTSHLGGEQQLRERKTVAPSTCPKRPRESPIDKPEPKSFIAEIHAGLCQGYIDPVDGRGYVGAGPSLELEKERQCPASLLAQNCSQGLGSWKRKQRGCSY
jgi:hypothetical protein